MENCCQIKVFRFAKLKDETYRTVIKKVVRHYCELKKEKQTDN